MIKTRREGTRTGQRGGLSPESVSSKVKVFSLVGENKKMAIGVKPKTEEPRWKAEQEIVRGPRSRLKTYRRGGLYAAVATLAIESLPYVLVWIVTT